MQPVKMSEILDALGRFLGYLRVHLFKGLLIVVIGALLGLVYAWVEKPAYKGKVSFILDEKSSGMAGGLAGLASQFGFDVGALGGSSGMLAGDNILDILTSESIVQTVLLSKTDTAAGKSSPTLADRYLVFSGLQQKWRKKEGPIASVSFASLAPGSAHSLVQDSVLYVLYERLVKKHIKAERLNKKGSIITVTAESVDPVFSKLFAERLVDETRKLYINVKTSVAAANMVPLGTSGSSIRIILSEHTKQHRKIFLHKTIAYSIAIDIHLVCISHPSNRQK
jgi:hypothetical protein